MKSTKLLSTIKPFLSYFLLVAVFSILFISVELMNGKLYANDFKVYYGATIDFFQGNNPYLKPYGLDTGLFKYPPPTLMFFSVATIFNFELARMIHIIIVIGCLIVALPIWSKVVSKVYLLELPKWLLPLSFFVIVIHLTRELHMGNVNILLLFTFIVGSWFLQKKMWIQASFFYAMMLILKPIMILVVIPLLLYRYWKLIVALSIWGVLFFIVPSFVWGWKMNLFLWDGWIKAVSSHGGYITNPSSLQFMIPALVGKEHSWFPSLVALIGLISCWLILKNKNNNSQKDFWFWMMIFLGFIPSFFVTDSQHFMLSIPTVMGLLFFANHFKSKILFGLFGAGMLLFSFDSMDLWGRELSTKFTDWGILGIGNLIFISSLLFVRYYFRSFFRAS